MIECVNGHLGLLALLLPRAGTKVCAQEHEHASLAMSILEVVQHFAGRASSGAEMEQTG